jgi:tRNA(Ile)-lysidine synthase
MRDIAARIESALDRPLGGDDRIAVAVSGGPDSVALLLIAATGFPGRVAALTVDHGLRAGAAAEAAAVARQCAAAGIPHAILAWLGDKPSANLQANARAARYRLMADWCVAHGFGILLTAHHADDQAETLLMRLARGSGNAGLAGIRARRELGQGVVLLRPLLGLRRADLAAIAAASGWDIADDPSNRDLRHDRTAARQLLANTPWLEVQRIADAAAHAAAAEAALAWTADFAWAGRAAARNNMVTLDTAGLPAELVFRLTTRAIAAIDPAAVPRGPDLARLITRLAAGGSGTIAGVAARGGAIWRFRIAVPRRPAG